MAQRTSLLRRWVIAGLALWLTATGGARGEEPLGSLVIVGGALRFQNTPVWSRIVELAGGKGTSIAVFPTASRNPERNGNRVVELLNGLGAAAFLVPLATENIAVDYRQVAADREIAARVEAAGGVFFLGGEQSRIVRALRTADGANTPLLDAVWKVFQKGGVVSGTSAGAAIMSRIMCRDIPKVFSALQNGVGMGREIDNGLGFMNPAWFVDQHCLIKGRFARALAIMHARGFRYGIGVDENTALVVRQNKVVDVIGYKGAIVLDLSRATTDTTVGGFNLKNARLTYLDHGDAIDLETLAVTPSQEKRDDEKLDPQAATFKPYYNETMVVNDILGNSAMPDLLYKLIDNRKDEAIGLAFDGLAARRERSPGFEFRFSRDQETVGWYTESFGSEDYTVVNVRLDVRPVTMAGPLYEPTE